ncbi:Rap family tetratricopeptide repeat protein [Bacillus paralicheniformis]|uniref:Rap family tetratricopeptide repeat protein n=1 Tax=Bacillus paralicheniformis TaxID=1648923 RepID=UPI003D22E070
MKLLSSDVGVKINKWYYHIRNFSVPDAELMKREVETSIVNMEEDQDLLLYYQLMEFRHRIMLEHLKPIENKKTKPSTRELLQQIESSQEKLNNLLQFYFNYFRGMYDFKHHDYLSAITFYKRAEDTLSLVPDDVEKAEFYFKVSEAYYHMKQTHFSIHYAVLARESYKSKNTYGLRFIQCNFVIAGNLIDLERHEEALELFEESYEEAKKIGNEYFLALSLNNIGECYNMKDEPESSIPYLEKALEIYIKDHTYNAVMTMFTLSLVLFKTKRYDYAVNIFEKGREYAHTLNDRLHLEKFNFLNGLFIENNENYVINSFDYLKGLKMYADIQDLALDTARYFKEKGKAEISLKYYEIVLEAKKEIQKGDYLNEI